jgi:hypothetical protein
MERTGGWPLNIMHSMAIDAGGYILIAIPDQGAPMNTVLIEVVDLGMTALTSLRDTAKRKVRIGDIMGTMAIGANGRLLITGGEGFSMNAVEGGVVVARMTLNTRSIKLKGNFSPGACGGLWVWKTRNIGMALNTGITSETVHGPFVVDRVDG